MRARVPSQCHRAQTQLSKRIQFHSSVVYTSQLQNRQFHSSTFTREVHERFKKMPMENIDVVHNEHGLVAKPIPHTNDIPHHNTISEPRPDDFIETDPKKLSGNRFKHAWESQAEKLYEHEMKTHRGDIFHTKMPKSVQGAVADMNLRGEHLYENRNKFPKQTIPKRDEDGIGRGAQYVERQVEEPENQNVVLPSNLK